MPDSAYLDTCIFIEAIQKIAGDRLDACQDLLDKAKKGTLFIVTSALTIVEVNKLADVEKHTGALREEQSKMILGFFENQYIKIRNLDRETAEYAHHLTRTHGLANADAVHVATAIVNAIPVIYTYDVVKGKRKGLLRHNLKIGTPPLRIEKPPDPSAVTLFDKTKVPSGNGADPEPSEK
jgi:predicted nucleic acid-binding protein